MKSAILEIGEQYYTYMSKVFNAIEDEQLKYNWLITDCECYPQDESLNELFSKEYVWISGKHLTDIINKEDFQFIWGVFSGFLPEVTLEEILKFNLPFADGYGGFWVDNVGIQHPLSTIEIVAWDSSLTLLISEYDDLVQKFMHNLPLAKDLSAENTRDNTEIANIEELLLNELDKRNIDVNENILHKRYIIWNKLFTKRETVIKDEDVLKLINEMLDQK
jgi:hypothetical protein